MASSHDITSCHDTLSDSDGPLLYGGLHRQTMKSYNPSLSYGQTAIDAASKFADVVI
jgi:hypothetical protein